MFEAVSVGDMHFDGAWANMVENHAQMLVNEIRRGPVKYATTKGIRHIILKGDVCNKPRLSYESYLALLKLFLKYSKLEWHLIPGNHEMFSVDPTVGHSLDIFKPLIKEGLLPNVHVYDTVTDVEIDGAALRFLPWPHQKFSKSRLNIAHVEVRGAKSDSGKVFDKAKNESDAVAIVGHLHTPHTVRNTHYGGTIIQQSFGEKAKKGFLHVQWNGPDDYEIDYVPHVPEYSLHTIVVESKKDLKRIPTDTKKLVRLVIENGADVDNTMWAGFSNVIKTTPFKSQADLQAVLDSEMTDGSSLSINTDDYFKAWLQLKQLDAKDEKRIIKRRYRAINGSNLYSNQTRASS
ncbi:Ser/Thr protein phosphatase [Achromobacter phage Motura]|uniref:Ser/Thr protein phosphatase n=1 Tax=Achromobacter phage Motura TaxID=2591403 RepID=A0A514CSJ4_9CAUD|nr:Ser/Thr protein phosphatase [Achromobacter phage Motura]QDH83449.1 Ser/Thr protein phosphatase [Achromobacter phage Motura]